nr:MAG TPA: hypothetical protein [Caudoviricetes sp.]
MESTVSIARRCFSYAGVAQQQGGACTTVLHGWLTWSADAGAHGPAARWVGRAQARASGLFLKNHVPYWGGPSSQAAPAENRGPRQLASPPVPKVL